MKNYEESMRIALEEAEQSLREGNCGFGAVIVKGEEIVARTRDTEKTEGDPTAHAELKVIRQAAACLGPNLQGCEIISTHEPCPMCATAILWSGIETIVYGYSIQEALREGRRRIDILCAEIFNRAGKGVTIREGILHHQCAILYHKEVRDQIEQLRKMGTVALDKMAAELSRKRLAWLETNRRLIDRTGKDPLHAAYHALLAKLDLAPDEAPILQQDEKQLVFASRNFCPTLEACRILKLDTRLVCKHLSENATDEFVRRIDPRLRFSRNYDTLRPTGSYCEEIITLTT
jgi:tRNA(adenine34) deaminase